LFWCTLFNSRTKICWSRYISLWERQILLETQQSEEVYNVIFWWQAISKQEVLVQQQALWIKSMELKCFRCYDFEMFRTLHGHIYD
jgi:hypothetical protein